MKKILALLLTLTMVIGLAACTGNSAITTSAETTKAAITTTVAETTKADVTTVATDKKIVVGFCPMDLSNNFFASIANSFEEAGKAAGITTIVTDGKSDAAKQVSALEDFISQKVDVIVVAPVDAESLKGVIAEAKAAGIPVITHTTTYADATCNMNVDELEMGTTLGEICGAWMAKTFGKDATCQYAILSQPTLEQTIGRENGIKAGIAKYCANAVNVITVPAHTTDMGITAAENILTAYPDVVAIVGINDSGALGAYETCIAQNVGDKFFLGGVDGTAQGLKLISEGSIFRGSVYLNPVGTGKQFIDYAIALSKGETIPASYMVPVSAITIDNVNQYIQ